MKTYKVTTVSSGSLDSVALFFKIFFYFMIIGVVLIIIFGIHFFIKEKEERPKREAARRERQRYLRENVQKTKILWSESDQVTQTNGNYSMGVIVRDKFVVSSSSPQTYRTSSANTKVLFRVYYKDGRVENQKIAQGTIEFEVYMEKLVAPNE